MPTLAFTPDERTKLAVILLEEIEAARLRSLVESWLGVNFDVIAPASSADTAPQELLNWVTLSGRTNDLVAGLLRDGPKGPKLSAFLSSFRSKEESPLHGLITFENPTAHWLVFAANQLRRGGQICRIEIGAKPMGTGVLIAPDRVLTAHHVIEGSLDQNGQPLEGAGEKIVCRFDHVALADGNELQAGFAVKLAADWLVVASPRHPEDGETLDLSNPPDCLTLLDYAVLRLSSAVGSAPVSVGGGAQRGWVEFPKAEPELEPEQPLIIGQHPGGHALQIAVGLFQSMDSRKGRLRYKVNTVKGASGAPCFNLRFDLVGLHHSEVTGKAVNQGVPVWLIRDHIAQHVHAPPPAALPGFVPLWQLQAGSPVLGRVVLQQQVWSMTAADSARRIAVVRGDPGTGRSFTIAIVKGMFARRPEVLVDYDMAGIQDKQPDALLLDLVRDLKLQVGPLPQRPTDRQSTRWASTTLFDWFVAAFASRFPAEGTDTPSVWIALDNFDRNPPRNDETRDVLVRLMRGAPQLRALRWIIIGKAPDPAEVPSELMQEETIRLPSEADVAEYLKRRVEHDNKTTAPGEIEDMTPGVIAYATARASTKRPFVATLAAGVAIFAAGL